MRSRHGVQEMVRDMESVEQQSWQRLADWMKQRYHGECSAVSALHKLASQAAFAGQPLPHQLDLQVPFHILLLLPYPSLVPGSLLFPFILFG